MRKMINWANIAWWFIIIVAVLLATSCSPDYTCPTYGFEPPQKVAEVEHWVCNGPGEELYIDNE